MFGSAIIFTDDNFLADVNKTTCKVTGVGCTKRCIGKTFSRTVRGNEEFDNVKTFTERSFNRDFD